MARNVEALDRAQFGRVVHKRPVQIITALVPQFGRSTRIYVDRRELVGLKILGERGCYVLVAKTGRYLAGPFHLKVDAAAVRDRIKRAAEVT